MRNVFHILGGKNYGTKSILLRNLLRNLRGLSRSRLIGLTGTYVPVRLIRQDTWEP
jgi:hypothetical protein